ncbi:MAG: tripartite tricarboxylate transporter substrate binding protein [Betaproteobacteria bacterium]|nr:tripartite tricarboxylate transporter substrate binding protein [Betaproteobacteria bacterium]
MRALAAVLAAVVALVPSVARAQAEPYPARAVRVLVGASPGGGTDIIARLLAEKFSQATKQPFLVENRAGASNTIASEGTAKAAPDGYTVLVGTNTAQSIAPHLMKLSFDPMKDLQPVGLIVQVPNVLIVGAAVPARNVRELIALMKSRPGELRYGSTGVGSTLHIAGEAFCLATGTQAIHVPYKGSSQAQGDLLGGSIEMMFDTASSATGTIKGGRVRPLAVMSARRSRELPEVPTLAEAGVPNVEMTTWYGMFTTAGTPRPVVDKLHALLEQAIRLPDVDARLRGLSGEPGALSIEQFAEMLRVDYERSGAMIRQAGIKAGP